MPRTPSAPNAQDGLRRKLWTSMRILRRFTLQELMTTSGAGKSHAHSYVQGLVRFGYVRIERTAGRATGSGVYAIARDTGPKAPLVSTNGCLYDGNLHQRIGLDERGEPAVLGEWWR